MEKILDEREPKLGMPAGGVRLLVAIESPRVCSTPIAIATASPRVMGLIFGAEDFARELGLPLRREGEARDLLYARSALVTAAAAAHVQSRGRRVDGPAGHGRAEADSPCSPAGLGFSGMSLIHPSQIEDVNAAFTPIG